MLQYLKQALEYLYKIKTTSFEPVFLILNSIYDLEIFRVANPDISPFYNDIRETVGVSILFELELQLFLSNDNFA